MPPLQIGDRSFAADLVVFDKDGTLIDFEPMWGRLAAAWIEHLVADVGRESLRPEFHRSLGYDIHRRRTLPQSPLAIATTDQLQTIVASVLYRAGIPWPEAEDRAWRAFDTDDELPLASLIHPTGDVTGLLARLQAAGVRVAVVTTDRRAKTEQTLYLMGITHLVDHTVCGDDGLPSKPMPDMLLAACQQLAVVPCRTVVVGDTVADLLMGQRAGAGLNVAVLTGAGDETQLRAAADVVLGSIDEIAVSDRRSVADRDRS